uniref:RNase H type-1 domain-containing protein n=1 Tax=Cannabis sativa TaxID=3483 RepID=A0A803QJY1_CANSA
MILQISSEDWGIEDQVMWHYGKTSEYTVRSGYKLAVAMLEKEAPSYAQHVERWWKYCLENKNSTKSETLRMESLSFMAAYKSCLDTSREANPHKKLKHQRELARWQLPPEGHCTINVDAETSSTLLAELRAIRDGIKVGLQCWFGRFIIKSDCQEAIQLIHRTEDSCRDEDGILQQIRTRGVRGAGSAVFDYFF